MSRRTHKIIALVAFIVFGFSIWQMTENVRSFQQTAPREVFGVQTISDREFGFAEKRVHIEDIVMPGGSEGIAVHFGAKSGDQTLELRAAMTPGHENLPNLERHKKWLAVVRFAPALGVPLEDIEDQIRAGTIVDRLAIVTRTQRQGTDEQTWGEIDKKAWRFDFYELLPDGTFEHTSGHLASNRKVADPAKGEIDRMSWQYPAAYKVMPNISFMPSVGGRPPAEIPPIVKSLGWTAPAAFISSLTLAFSLALGFGPERTEDENTPDTPLSGHNPSTA